MRRHLPFLIFLACLPIVFFVYLPGAAGYFQFDDTINIVENTYLQIHSLDFPTLRQAAYSGDAGMLGRPISTLSFALNYYFGGLNPHYFKLTNIVFHLLNGVCIFLLTCLVLEIQRPQNSSSLDRTASQWIALAVASAWLLHPLNLGAVLYIVQRMTSLAAFFTLLGLISYIYGRLKILDGDFGWGWIFAGFFVFTPMAMLCKENGALLPALLLLIEFVFFRFQLPKASGRRLLVALFCVTVILPVIVALTFILCNSAWLMHGYAIRDFSLAERVMTESRILWLYIRWTFMPDISQLGMFHDDIAISKNLLEPATTLIACLGILLSIIAAFCMRQRHPIIAFGILFFFIGHSIESSVLPLELVHEHRNYLPTYGLLLPLFYYLLYPLKHVQSLKSRRILATGFIFLLAGVLLLRSTQWGDPMLLKEMEVSRHPDSIRANIDIGNLYAAMPAVSQMQNDIFYRRAYEHYAKAASLSSRDTLGLFGLIALDSKHKVLVDEAWVRSLERRIENYPFSPNTGNSLVSLEKCLSLGDCTHSPEIMERLLQAALRNSTLNGKAKSAILFAQSDFLFRIRHDNESAVISAYEAVEAYPSEIDFHVTQIQLLINMGKADEALTAINKTRIIDKKQLFATTLNDLEKWASKSRANQSISKG